MDFSASHVNEIVKERAFGAAWNVIEERSPLFARRLLRPDELPEQIAIARRSLACLRDERLSGATKRRDEISISIRPLDHASRSHLVR